MRRYIRFAAVVLLTVAVTQGSFVSPAAAGKVHDPQKVCRTSEGNGWSRKDLHQLVGCVTSRWHVPGGAAKERQVIGCESSWHIHDSNSCCHGLLQLHESYFGSWLRRFNPHHGWKLSHHIENPRTNIVVGTRLARAQGWSPTWACG